MKDFASISNTNTLNDSELKLFLMEQGHSNSSLIVVQKLAYTVKNAVEVECDNKCVITSVRYGLIPHTVHWVQYNIGVAHCC